MLSQYRVQIDGVWFKRVCIKTKLGTKGGVDVYLSTAGYVNEDEYIKTKIKSTDWGQTEMPAKLDETTKGT